MQLQEASGFTGKYGLNFVSHQHLQHRLKEMSPSKLYLLLARLYFLYSLSTLSLYSLGKLLSVFSLNGFIHN